MNNLGTIFRGYENSDRRSISVAWFLFRAKKKCILFFHLDLIHESYKRRRHLKTNAINAKEADYQKIIPKNTHLLPRRCLLFTCVRSWKEKER